MNLRLNQFCTKQKKSFLSKLPSILGERVGTKDYRFIIRIGIFISIAVNYSVRAPADLAMSPFRSAGHLLGSMYIDHIYRDSINSCSLSQRWIMFDEKRWACNIFAFDM